MKAVFTWFCLLTLFFVKGQNVILENLDYELRLGANNYLEMRIDGYDCSKVKTSCSNGQINIDSCTIHLMPDTLGLCRLIFYNLEKNDSVYLGTKSFRVTKIPNPEPSMFRRKSGELSSEIISNGLIELENTQYSKMGCGIYFPVKEFKILATRKDSLIGCFYNLGAKVNPENGDFIRSLQSGDRVLFFDITGMNYYMEYVTMKNLEFYIN